MLKSAPLFARHLRGKKGLLGSVFLLGLAGSAVSLATPLIGKTFIDAVSERGDYSVVPRIALALLGLALAELAVGTLTRVVHAKLSADVLVEMRERIFAHCLNAPLAALEKFRHGDLLSRFGTDVPKIQALLVDGALGFVQNSLFLLVAASILFKLSAGLALWSFLGLALALAATSAFRHPIEKGSREIRETMAGLSHFLSERLGALRAVRLHRAQKEEEERFAGHNAELVGKMLRFQALDSMATGLPGILLAGALAWIYFLGGGLLERGEITLGTFVAFILYQGRLYGPARGMLGLVRNLQEVRVSLERVAEVLDGEGTAGRAAEEGGMQGELRFEGIEFAYPESDPILRGVDLILPAGERVALFGTSGAGKSTLVQILFGLRPPRCGKMHPGGKLGYAGSEPFLLHATVEENLRYGNPRATLDEITAAARLAEAHDFIEALPEGYRTVIGGRGQALSDGQRQRLGIARVILYRPDVLVLDEAFSAMDAETGGRVRNNLWNVSRGRTIVAVTHDLEDIGGFDRLLLLRGGRLRQVGEKELRIALGAPGEKRAVHQGEPAAVNVSGERSGRGPQRISA